MQTTGRANDWKECGKLQVSLKLAAGKTVRTTVRRVPAVALLSRNCPGSFRSAIPCSTYDDEVNGINY